MASGSTSKHILLTIVIKLPGHCLTVSLMHAGYVEIFRTSCREDSGRLNLREQDVNATEVGKLVTELEAAFEKLLAAGGADECLFSMGRLDLGSNLFGDSGLECFAGLLPRVLQVSELVLSDNNISATSVAVFVSALAKGQSGRLTHLDISENEIGDAGTARISSILPMPCCSALQELKLFNNEIGDPGDRACVCACCRAGSTPTAR
jgi:hypothetical protein